MFKNNIVSLPDTIKSESSWAWFFVTLFSGKTLLQPSSTTVPWTCLQYHSSMNLFSLAAQLRTPVVVKKKAGRLAPWLFLRNSDCLEQFDHHLASKAPEGWRAGNASREPNFIKNLEEVNRARQSVTKATRMGLLIAIVNLKIWIQAFL